MSASSTEILVLWFSLAAVYGIYLLINWLVDDVLGLKGRTEEQIAAGFKRQLTSRAGRPVD